MLQPLLHHHLFFELIQVGIGEREQLSSIPSDKEWKELLAESQRQTVVGVAFEGIQKLLKQQYPPKGILYQWIGLCEQIRRQNTLLNRRVVEASDFFSEAGYRSCILKGQGNAQMYPNPQSRTPGDIDIWVDGTRKEITDFVRTRVPEAYGQYHHIDFPMFKDVAVEVHFKPSRQNNPVYNRRLQQFYLQHREAQFRNVCQKLDEQGRVCVPTNDFNLVFQLSHVMNHFFVEGVGLRQLIDYYYLLRQDYSDAERKEFQDNVRWLGMEKFASSVMWVLKEILGMDGQYALVKPYEKGGRLLLDEVMLTGNFGHYDTRYEFRKKGKFSRVLTDLYRDLRMAKVFPSEALCMPWAKIENQLYKSEK